MRASWWVLALMLVGCPAWGEEAESVASSLTAELLVEIRHLDGSVQKFGREVAGMEIIVAPDSSIQYIHLILVSGSEKDTHAWFNYHQLAGFQYQFAAITGKGKIRIKQLGTFKVSEITGMKESIPQLDVNDFK